MLKKTVCLPLLLALLAVLPVPAFAISSLSISSPASDGVFVLTGDHMAGVAGLDIRIGYDATKLSNPRVTMGGLVGGMMSAANPANPIRMAIVSTRVIGGSGSGVIATITFDRLGSSPGRITSVTASLIDADGKKVAVAQPVISNPAEPATADNQTDTGNTGNTGGTGNSQTDNSSSSTSGNESVTTTTTSTNTGSRPYMVGGTLTLPPEMQTDEKKQAPTPTLLPDNHEPQVEQADTPPPPEREQHETKDAAKAPAAEVTAPKPITSGLERFRVFQGEKSLATLSALLKTDADDIFTQLPAAALADGKTTLTLFIAMNTGDKAPNFAFTSARFVSVNHTEKGWELEVKPEKDALNASVTMLYDGHSQDIPLTVAPKAALVAGTARPVSEADYQMFLKERGTPEKPKFDLNGDGKRDYIDDYIYTVNYLVKLEEQARKSGTKK